MKTTVKFLCVLALAGITLFLACQKENKPSQAILSISKKPVSNLSILANTDSITALLNDHGWFPPESKMEMRGDTMIVTTPAGWAYLGRTASGQVLDFSKNEPTVTSITCTCNGNGQCHPFSAHSPFGSTVGCYGGCGFCFSEQSLAYGRATPVQPAKGGFYQPDAETRLLKSGEQIPAVFEQLVETEAYQAKLKALFDLAYRGRPVTKGILLKDGTIKAPSGFSFVGVSIMSRGSLVLLPNDYIKSILGYTGTESASCTCTKSTGGCKVNEKGAFGFGSVYCSGDCNGCKLILSKATEYEVGIYSALL